MAVSQKARGKRRTSLSSRPIRRRLMASRFQGGNGGENSRPWLCKTPSGSVRIATSAERIPWLVTTVTPHGP